MVQVTARLGDTTQSFQYEEAHYGDLIAILLYGCMPVSGCD